jgi:carbon monoxide dehydrogenase subunit G
MARYITTVRTPRSPAEAFAYLADLRNFAEWDPGVRRVTQVEGHGAGPEATFDVTVAGVGPGPDLTLRYRTLEHDAPHEVLVRADHVLLTSEDRITVRPDDGEEGGGSIVTYDADLRLAGLLRLGDPVLRMVFGRIGDRAAAGLRHALEGERVA